MVVALKKYGVISLLLGIMLVMLPACKITGNVSLDGAGIEGATVILANGDMEVTTTTDEDGDYSFAKIPKGQYTVTLLSPDGFSGKAIKRIIKSGDKVNVSDVDFSMDSSTMKTIASGRIMGTRDDNGVAVWWGIPFAAPPTGDLRWKAPVPEAAWGQDPYLAVEPCIPCMQYADMLNDGPLEYFGTLLGGEDCLYLNIWADDSQAHEKKPVMFWIHGGGNTLGEGSIYNGRMLAERYDVVVVTINYRLGPFGWFSHSALNAEDGSAEDLSGNYGTLDMIRALTWVQENIEAFGGDPDNVMVFGESAGGQATLSMMASPLASGLFHKAAVESGVLGWVANHTAWQTTAIAENYMDDPDPGLSRSSRESVNNLLIVKGLAQDRTEAKTIQESMAPDALEDFLRGLSPEEIMSVYDYEPALGGIIYMPTVIRDGFVIPDMDPFDLFESGQYNQVPTIVGTNRDERKLFMMMDPQYVYNIFELIPLVLDHSDYDLSAYYYSKAWKALMADRLSTALAVNQPDSIYTYRFDWDEEPNIMGFDISFIVGAAHGMEIPFVFAAPDDTVVQSKKTFFYTSANQAGRDAMAESMSSYWVALAYEGAPGKGMPQAQQDSVWTPWNTEADQDKIMIFDTPEGGGTSMSPLLITMEDVRHELMAETGFPHELKCQVYYNIYGSDDYYHGLCSE